ncbi:MAG: TIGR03936 family radical SAM-associated protein [Candidatus Bathyarchaeia archaeon]
MNGSFKLRITYSQTGPLKYLSHLDLIRLWERLLRRAGIPLAYSHGFTPHPKITVASPLPVGFEGLNEVMEIALTSSILPEEFLAKVRPHLPQGLDIVQVEVVRDNKVSLPQRVEASEYLVVMPDCEKGEELVQEIRRLLSRNSIPFRREKGGKVREYDLKPLIKGLKLMESDEPGCVLWMLLETSPSATARPEDVLKVLGLEGFAKIKRLRIHFKEVNNGS